MTLISLHRLYKPSTSLRIFLSERRMRRLKQTLLVSLSNQQPSVKGDSLICADLKTENGYDSYFFSRNHSGH